MCILELLQSDQPVFPEHLFCAQHCTFYVSYVHTETLYIKIIITRMLIYLSKSFMYRTRARILLILIPLHFPMPGIDRILLILIPLRFPMPGTDSH